MRKRVPKSVDKKIFTRTASTVKRVNLPGIIYRGGFRF